MGSRIEILNEAGFRSDGRRQYELRSIEIDLSQHATADGTAIVTHGLTQAMVSVFGPREARLRGQKTLFDRAVLNVELSVASFSGGDRRRGNRGDKRLVELASTIKATFEPVIQTTLYPRSQIDIFVQVLQLDGGVLQASINATTLALMNAGVAMSDFVCAVTGGVHSTSVILDLTLVEENDVPHMTVAVMPKAKTISMLSLDARLHTDQFRDLLQAAKEATRVVHSEMKGAMIAKAHTMLPAQDKDEGVAHE